VIHSTAGKVDPGFKGHLVLEITNIGTVPIMLYPEMRICQLLFEQLSSPTTQVYTERKNSKYKFQKGTTSSKF
jgi:dCTP deaminase